MLTTQTEREQTSEAHTANRVVVILIESPILSKNPTQSGEEGTKVYTESITGLGDPSSSQ